MPLCPVLLAALLASSGARAADPAPSTENPVLVERLGLLMAATLAAAATGSQAHAAALIAWGADDPNALPEGNVLIRQDRVQERGEETAHAEKLAIDAAFERRREYDPAYSGAYDYALSAKNFQGAVLFSIVEPCPMCQTTATLARVPLSYSCAEDPSLRDRRTKQRSAGVPEEMFGRRMERRLMPTPLCRRLKDALWSLADQTPARESFHVLPSLRRLLGGAQWRRAALEELRRDVRPQNAAWRDALLREIGEPRQAP